MIDAVNSSVKAVQNFPLFAPSDITNMATFLNSLNLGDIVAMSSRDVPIARVVLFVDAFTAINSCYNEPTLRVTCDPGRGNVQAVPFSSYVANLLQSMQCTGSQSSVFRFLS